MSEPVVAAAEPALSTSNGSAALSAWLVGVFSFGRCLGHAISILASLGVEIVLTTLGVASWRLRLVIANLVFYRRL